MRFSLFLLNPWTSSITYIVTCQNVFLVNIKSLWYLLKQYATYLRDLGVHTINQARKTTGFQSGWPVMGREHLWKLFAHLRINLKAVILGGEGKIPFSSFGASYLPAFCLPTSICWAKMEKWGLTDLGFDSWLCDRDTLLSHYDTCQRVIRLKRSSSILLQILSKQYAGLWKGKWLTELSGWQCT